MTKGTDRDARYLRRMLARAARDHQDGRLQRAETVYREILMRVPAQPDALHGLGLIALQAGRTDLAIAHIGQAAKLVPDSALFHLDLGLALREAGHVEQARAAFHVACLLDETDHAAPAAMGDALVRLGRLEEAEAAYLVSTRLAPGRAEVRRALGLVTQAMGRSAEAAGHFGMGVALAPDDVEMRNNLGAARRAAGDPVGAERAWRDVLARRPDHPAALNNLGLLLQDLEQGEAAEATLRAALRADPDNPDISGNLGLALRDLGRLEEALACFDSALAKNPDHAEAHLNAASVLLLRGEYRRGWEEFEWRDRVAGAVRPALSAPLWQGEDLAGRTLLVRAEMGLGDTIQFCRYLPLIEGGRVIIQAPATLARLLAGVAEVVTQGETQPEADLHCPMASLPRLFATTPETIPAKTPYLHPDPMAVAAWRARLGVLAGLRVGVCWAGSAGYARDRRRSIAPALLRPLADIPGVSLVSLQKDAADPGWPITDWTAELADMADTAALVGALDLVVSVDTAVAHLAGALGRPVFLLNRFAGDWRWFEGRADSPWYPTLRVFRQSAPGDWTSVLAEVAAAVAS